MQRFLWFKEKEELDSGEYEFTEELMARGYKEVLERIRIIEPPIVTSTVNTCERLAEQWKWNEFGDIIRSLVKGVSCAG